MEIELVLQKKDISSSPLWAPSYPLPLCHYVIFWPTPRPPSPANGDVIYEQPLTMVIFIIIMRKGQNGPKSLLQQLKWFFMITSSSHEDDNIMTKIHFIHHYRAK